MATDEKADLFRSLVESSPDGLWLSDGDGVLLHANPAGLALLGLDPEADHGPVLLDELLAPLAGETTRRRLGDLRELGLGSGGAETELELGEGPEHAWYLVKVSLVRDGDGTPRGLLHRLVDHTDEHRRRERIADARSVLEGAQRIARMGSFTWDGTPHGVLSAEALEELDGDEATPPTTYAEWVARLHPEDRGRLEATVADALAHGTEYDIEARSPDPTGEGWIWIRSRALVHRDDAGSVVSVTGTYQDVSEVKAAEAALVDQVRRTTVLRAVTAAANQSRSFAQACRAARQLSRGQTPWRDMHAFSLDGDEFVPHEGKAPTSARELAREALTHGGIAWSADRRDLAFACGYDDVTAGVLVLEGADGPSSPEERRTTEESAVAVGLQLGRVAERERSQESLARALDEATAASRHKSEFLATMSHEIRTPLNGIIGLNDLLLRTDLQPEQLRLTSGVQVAGRALLSVINDVLDFSTIEAGQLEIERVDFEARQLLDQVARVLGQAARERDVELVLTCEPEVPAMLSGDPTRLLQVLIHLASNAVKFSEASVVTVRLGRDEDSRPTPEASVPRVRLRVEVVDEGIGIDPEALDRLFEPFTQADATSTRPFGGTGLGLAIARQIVSALGGELTHQPNPRGGSVFAFTVELGVPISAPGPLDEYARTWLAGRRILVVHPGDELQEQVTGQLDWWRMRASVVDDAGAALASLRTSVEDGDPFDAVLIALDDESDLELTRGIAAEPAFDEVTMVLLVTGEVDAAAVRETGVSVCLTRPVPAGVLRGTLLEQLVGVASQPLERAVDVPSELHRRILVVEDNPVNQMVATGLLEALGYDVDVAGDGSIALDMLARSSYDGVLMDVQMPVLDGYATTRALREREASDGAARMPVVAMTAAAIEGERERCLDSGMDDFLTKPVDPITLAATLDRWLGPAAPAVPQDSGSGVTAPPTPAIEGLDTERLDMLRDLDPGDTTYLDRAIGNFQANSISAVDDVVRLRRAGDAAGVRAAAHKIAGSALNLGVNAAGEAAREVELLAEEGRLDELDSPTEALVAQMAVARDLLLRYQETYRGEAT